MGMTTSTKATLFTSLSFLFMVSVAHAATNTVSSDISAFLTFINGYVVPLIFAVAFLLFLWGVFRYFIAGGDSDENRKEGRQFVLYAIIGFVLMVCVWGIVNLIKSSIGLGSNSEPSLPLINGGGTGGNGYTQNGNVQNGNFGGGLNFGR